MNKYDYKNIAPFKWFMLENFPFIEDDFDALTNWQLFCKIGKEINKIINSQNEVGNQMENTVNAFIALQDYVNNYFDNLDVQEEINNKLDNMVEDGTLLNILSNYANIQRIYNTVNEMIEDTNLVSGQKVKCFGFNEINDGDGGEFLIGNVGEIDLDNNLKAKYINNYENNFYDEIVYSTERLNDTDCYSILIPKKDNNNNYIIPFVSKDNNNSPMKHAQKENTNVTINASLNIRNTAGGTSGIPIIIGNGEILNNNSMYGEEGIADNYLYVGITDTREIKEFKVNETTAQQLLGQGCNQVFNVYYKLIENFIPVDLSNVVTNEPTVVTDPNPRMVFCEMQNGDILIFACDGRTGESIGLTSTELQNILVQKGVKNAWNLDGGGSTSLNYKATKMNRNIDNQGTVDRWIKFTLNVKKNTINKNTADIYSQIGFIKQNIVSQIMPVIPKIQTYSGKDVNDLIGDLYFVIGNRMINTPLEPGNGYIINISNIISNNRNLWNKQIFLGRDSNTMFTRTQVNGIWGAWKLANGTPAVNFIAQRSDGANNILADATYQNIKIGSWKGSSFSGQQIYKITETGDETQDDQYFIIKNCTVAKLTCNLVILSASDNHAKYVRVTKNDIVQTDSTTNITVKQGEKGILTLTYFILNPTEQDKYALQIFGDTGDNIERGYITVEILQ